MQIKKLKLNHFRNIQELEFSPLERITFFIGKNGQGKTSLLEAISFLSGFRSFRNAKNEEVILKKTNRKENWSELSALIGDQETESKIKITFSLQEDKVVKSAFIDQQPIKSSSKFLLHRYGSQSFIFHSIVFNPADHDLIRGEPSLRRNYLDRILSLENSEYLLRLKKYQKYLEHRNAFLKEAKETGMRDEFLYEELTQGLIEQGSWLTLERLRLIQETREELNNAFHQICPQMSSFLGLIYESNWLPKKENLINYFNNLNNSHFALQSPEITLNFIADSFKQKILEKANQERFAGLTLYGPHRDDFGFVYENQELKGRGSQGEVRTALLALKMTEIARFKSKTGFKPILLLDDFSSELDSERRKFLLNYLSKTDLQVFVTSTEEPSQDIGKIYYVEEGQIKSQ